MRFLLDTDHIGIQGLTLLTRNSRDFSRVPGLVIEDWTI
jgi:predicted nucleic acid-binding protein